MSDNDSTAITQRLSLEQTAPATPRVEFELRLEESRARLREAMALVKVKARELTPAARINADPARWILGGFAIGLAVSWLTAGRR